MSLETYYEELIQIYDNIRKCNEEFLKNSASVDDFEELINTRSVLFDNIDILKIELIKEIKRLNIEKNYNSTDLINIIKDLPNNQSSLLPYRNKVIEALEKLVASENNVSEYMEAQKEDIKKEITQARASKKTLNAYKPVTGYSGSHFIDSKK